MHKCLFLALFVAVSFLNPVKGQSKMDGYTANGKNVYVTSNDSMMQIYAADCLKKWHYWHVVDDPAKADLTLSFIKVVNANGHTYGYVDYIDPATEKTLYESKPMHQRGKIFSPISQHFVADMVRAKIIDWADERDSHQ